MSVPSALTAILTLGPAYGLQLHAELASRLPHRSSTNVGQIYSTLDRLVRDNLVERVGETDDALPLYRATPTGLSSTRSWLSGEGFSESMPWVEFLDVVLLGSTMSGAPVQAACNKALELFSQPSSSGGLSETAGRYFAQAVCSTSKDILQAARNNALPQRPLTDERPARGRKPNINP
jgi:DNA-binding PadR family transcriptional regulator